MMQQDEQYELNAQVGEYVLGTLQGEERVRFEQRLAGDYALQAEVTAWEQRLAPMLDCMEPVSPPAAVWQKIQHRIDSPRAVQKNTLWESLIFWRGLTLVTASLVLGLSLSLLTLRPLTGDLDRMMVVMNDRSEAGWIVGAGAREPMLQVSALHPTQLPANQVCQLWMETKPGRLVPVGILPHKGTRAMKLPAAPKTDSQFLVTIEAASQAPAQVPSSEVVFEGRLTAI